MAKRGGKKALRKSRSSSRISFRARKPPISIKIVSIYFYLMALIVLLLGLLVFLGGIIGATFFSSANLAWLYNIFPSLFVVNSFITKGIFATLIIVGLLVILWAVVQFFIGKGLWKGRKLAFAAASLLLGIEFLTFLILILTFNFNALWGFILYAVLGYLLVGDSKSRVFFDLNKKLKVRRK